MGEEELCKEEILGAGSCRLVQAIFHKLIKPLIGECSSIAINFFSINKHDQRRVSHDIKVFRQFRVNRSIYFGNYNSALIRFRKPF